MQRRDLGELERAADQEVERGIRCARQAHYADAAVHFAVARADLRPGQLASAIDAFIACHHRYWQSQLALHEASRLFSAVEADQCARLDDLQQIVSTYLHDDQPCPPASSPNRPALGSGQNSGAVVPTRAWRCIACIIDHLLWALRGPARRGCH